MSKAFVALIAAICAYLIFKYKAQHIESIDDVKEIFYNLFFSSSVPVFTPDELKTYNGENGSPIYLAILGKVFDVTKGKKYYGKGGSYSFFAGIDASKAFVSGDFSESGLTDDISELSVEELGELHDWAKMYKKDYIYKGKLVGRFYDSNGLPTQFLKEVEEKLFILDSIKKQVDFDKQKYPPCNVEWTAETGSRFWCSKNSGGISRSWIGVPRKYFKPGSDKYRCACINTNDPTLLKKFPLYENCPPDSVSCFLKQAD